MEHTAGIESPVGRLVLVSDGASLTAIQFGGKRAGADDCAVPLPEAKRELAEYFAGRRRSFDLSLAPRGTPFQRRVWEALRRIPYGATATYGEIARAVGSPGAVRAVGAACARNPVPIIVPCHRVIGADGTLTGYAGGLERKRALLELESEHARENPAPRRANGT